MDPQNIYPSSPSAPSSKQRDEFMRLLVMFLVIVLVCAAIVLVIIYLPRLWGGGSVPAVPRAEVATSNELLAVTSPEPYAQVQSPVTVAGKSNFFEANTRIRIKDENGQVLADTYTTAEGWTDALYPFTQEVDYDTPTAQTGVVEVFEESAKDGSEINKITIPVTFQDAQAATVPAAQKAGWKTTDLMGVYTFGYPSGWHVANQWSYDAKEGIVVYISPTPIDTAPRGGPFGAIIITDKSGSQDATALFELEKADYKSALTEVSEEELTTDSGINVNHITGKAEGYGEQIDVEAYFLLLEGPLPDQANMHVLQVTEDLSMTGGEKYKETLRDLVKSIKRK